MKNKLGVPVKFIILNVWSLCDAWLLPKTMTYLLEIFVWHSKVCTFIFSFMFCVFFMISSKYVDLHTFNLVPKHICLHWIMKNTKNGNRWCFKILYCVPSKFMRCFVCSCNEILNDLFSILETPIPKGSKLGNMHDIKDGLLYTLTILYLWL